MHAGPSAQANFRAQALQIAGGPTFFYQQRASNGFYLGPSPEHHRASLDSWKRIWDWKRVLSDMLRG
jgi:hypothetical protein